jgi:SMODS-associating 2TM, beta-strand rich effector domain
MAVRGEKLMPSSNWIRIVIGLVALAMIGLTTLTGDSINQEGLRWLGSIASGITLLLLAFDRWIWRWPVIRKVTEVTGSRVIHGTWRGTLSYVADGDGASGEQQIFMAVHQTYSTVSVRCYFPSRNSESWSLTAAIEKGAHRYVLRYIYRQQAVAPDRERNRPTEGACELVLVGRPVEEVSGSYYAERGGKGTIKFDGYVPKVAGSASHASRMSFRSLEG